MRTCPNLLVIGAFLFIAGAVCIRVGWVRKSRILLSRAGNGHPYQQRVNDLLFLGYSSMVTGVALITTYLYYLSR